VEDVFKWLDLVTRELGAVDARLELGGKPPEDERMLHRPVPGGFRLVVVFAEPPADRDKVMASVDSYVATFASVVREARKSVPKPTVSVAGRELSDFLSGLADRVAAERAVVFDDRSPVLFGDSHDTTTALDIDDAVFGGRLLERISLSAGEIADILDDPHHEGDLGVGHRALRQLEVVSRPPDGVPREAQLRLLASVNLVRAAPQGERWADHQGPVPHLARAFAGVYRVLLVFHGTFSEMHAEGTLIRALPTLERLVLALPPHDPQGRAKVERLRPR
jgi:hypothetical protein